MANKEVIKILSDHNLKITPQRTAVLEVIMGLENHPSADVILDYLRLNYPHVPIGTVYKILKIFTEKGIIKKVISDEDHMRYDAIHEKHHHLYCAETEKLEDFYDDELNKLLKKHFRKKSIPNFKIEDIQVQIIGKFIKKEQPDK